jgi:prepilin peptidase CpaA
MQVGYILVALVASFTAACAVVDYRSKRIPNWLTVPAAVLGLIFHLATGGGPGILWALAGFAVGFSLLILPWLLGGGGMGDVKMLAALGVWLGPLGILIAFGVSTMLAAFGMILMLINSTFSEGFSVTRKRYVSVAAGGASGTSAGPRKVRRVLPFAVPLALGTWIVLGWMLLKVHG